MEFHPYTPEASSILLGISGGLDSSASLIRLKSRGVDLRAAMLLLQAEPFSIPDSHHLRMAEELSRKLEVPFEVIDAEKPFKKHVRTYFEESYSAGLTPCPCSLCNQHVKVPLLLKAAQSKGIPFVATGHYASLYVDSEGKTFIGRGADASKDQSYFLSRLPSDQIKHLYFPLENENKQNLREDASNQNLPVSDMEESSDICFVAGRVYTDLLRTAVPGAFREGNFIDEKGTVLGKHRGIAFYTVGQRKRIGLPGGPWFVKAIHENTNEIILVKGERPLATTFSIAQLTLNIKEHSLFMNENSIEVQTHYRSQAIPARFEKNGDSLRVFCENPILAAPGQICALYAGKVVLGSGIIQKEG